MKKINDKNKKEIQVIGDYTLEVDGSLGKKIAFLKTPGRDTFKKVFPMISPFDDSKPDYIGAGEIILRECFVGGDTEIQTVDEYILAGSIQAMGIIKIADATLKKN